MSVTVVNADVMDGLRSLESDSVQCCVTSPPYWGLRDYQTGTWDGGDPACDHASPISPRRDSPGGFQNSTSRGTHPSTASVLMQYRSVCAKCNAVRIDQQIGLEKTPAEFVARLVEVFEEVRRVLKPDGVCFVNLGDSYAASTKGSSGVGDKQTSNAGTILKDRRWAIPQGLKPKDLVGIPWRVAFALQDAGWWLRQDIIWHKPNPMPESVTDRCTKSHEYIFLLTKSARYFWDAEAIKEAAVQPSGIAILTGQHKASAGGFTTNGTGNSTLGSNQGDAHRNKRSVWTIATAPFAEAHFATFPPELPEICIKAGSKPGDTVLDPFGGAGTTGLVADRLQRNAILIELNPEYAAMASKRVSTDRGGLLDLMEA